MFKEKEVWDVVDGSCAKLTITPQTKEKENDNTVTSKIIKQGVNNNLYINIIRKRKF